MPDESFLWFQLWLGEWGRILLLTQYSECPHIITFPFLSNHIAKGHINKNTRITMSVMSQKIHMKRQDGCCRRQNNEKKITATLIKELTTAEIVYMLYSLHN